MDLPEINRAWLESFSSMKRHSQSRLWVAFNAVCLALLWAVFFVGVWAALFYHCFRPDRDRRA